MATESVTSKIANDLGIVMDHLENAKVMVMLAVKADDLNANDARTVFNQLRGILEIAHNDIDVARERLEA